MQHRLLDVSAGTLDVARLANDHDILVSRKLTGDVHFNLVIVLNVSQFRTLRANQEWKAPLLDLQFFVGLSWVCKIMVAVP